MKSNKPKLSNSASAVIEFIVVTICTLILVDIISVRLTSYINKSVNSEESNTTTISEYSSEEYTESTSLIEKSSIPDSSEVDSVADQIEYKGTVLAEGSILQSSDYESSNDYEPVSDWYNYDCRTTYDYINRVKLIEYLSIDRYDFIDPEELADSILDANERGVSPLLMIAIVRVESGNGSSYLARNQNNYTGTVAKSGDYDSFESISACIDHTADNLYNNYLYPDGKYYHGSNVAGISQCYSHDESVEDAWISLVMEIMEHAEEHILMDVVDE